MQLNPLPFEAEALIDLIPGDTDATRLEVWRCVDASGERRTEIRLAVHNPGTGWSTQRRINLCDAQATALRQALGWASGPAGPAVAAAAPSARPIPSAQDTQVISFAAARQRRGL
jgi:hypothetical protein